MCTIFLLLHSAFAEYPSPTPKDAVTVYQSVGFGQWSNYRIREGANTTPNPIQRFFAQTSVGYGVAQNFDIQLTLPIIHSIFGDEDPITGIGFAEVASKITLLQEGVAPVTASVRPAIRVGLHHAEQRGKLHNIGEGTLDFGVGLALGKLEYVGMGFYWFDMGIRYWHRVSASFDLSAPPSPDMMFDANVGYSFHPSFAVSATVAGIQRLGGEDYPATEADSIDQWAALEITQIKTGGKLSYFATEKMTIDLVGLRSIFAINNPVDELYVGVGINYFQPPSR